MRPAFFLAVLSSALVAAQWKLVCSPVPTDSCRPFCQCVGGMRDCPVSPPPQCQQYCRCDVDNSNPPPPYTGGRNGGGKPSPHNLPTPPQDGSSPRRAGRPKRLARRIMRN
ncbi:hypothetical protein GGTG_11837 [Gaeumannomyces tritici R3-111a-1]|uniref:Extracellular membrane protein CFEM domain-containing protein n=1 Tax=Gaeumannomyces tritici (strain R3-111a-1) TaxID=644352 RepID=J3PEB4_GAET3|nr:hypothetical protein GGTG_11837 [Gaeumannomyces tritici R3-111a-1]EJT70814.1 hypothetical protein GGTG_11837 [Gaeumannomyces tritici R3-111a-1]